jgi:hypothetical protein
MTLWELATRVTELMAEGVDPDTEVCPTDPYGTPERGLFFGLSVETFGSFTFLSLGLTVGSDPD